MQTALTIIGSIIVAVSFLPYLISTIKGKVKPRIASWISWSLITGIATIAAISAKAYTSAILTGLSTIITLAVLLAALKKGDKTYKKIDGVCQVLSFIGLAAWLLSNNPLWAIVFNIVADLFAAVPTLYHGWVKPHEEAYQSFFVFAIGSFMTIFGLREFTFLNAAFPIYFTCLAGSIAATIYLRQKVVAHDVQKPL